MAKITKIIQKEFPKYNLELDAYELMALHVILLNVVNLKGGCTRFKDNTLDNFNKFVEEKLQ